MCAWGHGERRNLIFGGISGTVQEHLWYNFKENNAYLKAKDPVYDSSKINISKVLFAVMTEPKTFYCLA